MSPEKLANYNSINPNPNQRDSDLVTSKKALSPLMIGLSLVFLTLLVLGASYYSGAIHF